MKGDSNAHKIPRQSPGYLLEELDGDLLLFHEQSGRLVKVNETAALVWQLADGRRSTAQITALLAATYPEAAAAVKTDVPTAVDELTRAGVLETGAPA